MLSSLKQTAVLFLVALLSLSVAYEQQQQEQGDASTTTAAVAEQRLTEPQTAEEIVEKSVKIFFPSVSDSDEDSIFDVYGLKVMPTPITEGHSRSIVMPNDELLAASKSTATATTISSNLLSEISTAATPSVDIATSTATSISSTPRLKSNSGSNTTKPSIDDRLGILNLPPHCPDGYVVVNQRCHRQV